MKRHINKSKKVLFFVATLCLSISCIRTVSAETKVAIDNQTIALEVKDNESQLSNEEKLFGLSTIWKTANEMYAFWELFPELDWDEFYMQYIPKVLETNTIDEYYYQLTKFVAALGDDHSGVYYPLEVKTNRLPINLSFVDNEYIVSFKNDNLTDIPIGSIISKINGIPINDYLESKFSEITPSKTNLYRQQALAQKLTSSYSETGDLIVEYITPEKEELSGTLQYYQNKPSFESKILWNYTNEKDFVQHYRFNTFFSSEFKNGIYLIKISDFFNMSLVGEIKTFLNNINSKATSFIIDIRDHSGGNSNIGLDILNLFIDEKDLKPILTRKQYRDIYSMASASYFNSMNDVELNKLFSQYPETKKLYSDGNLMLKGRYYESNILAEDSEEPVSTDLKYFTQPVVILSDFLTGSAGEDFVAYAKDTGRFTIMGTNTAGKTGQIGRFTLPGGGGFFISTLKCLTYDGQDILNNGVQPDIWSSQDYEDLLIGRDTTLMDALDFLNPSRSTLEK